MCTRITILYNVLDSSPVGFSSFVFTSAELAVSHHGDWQWQLCRDKARGGLYPNLEELGDYMGLALNSDEVQRNMALVPVADNVSILVHLKIFGWFIIDVGIVRAEIRPGLREIILCKDQDRKVGLRLRAIDNGLFLQLVQANSPAALAGLRFGDQVLQINGQNCAGWSTDKAHKALKAAAETRIEMVVRDSWELSR
ncbi:hypothetical protein GOODEAATRI_007869 [Goodea atripinnis]|uniref:PDZ domain-containing protein n=1 Tax=Goodea atripinnis TaxID=208336 RepID=A0ABV0P2J6_9TELE